jgi:hypothetical protein
MKLRWIEPAMAAAVLFLSLPQAAGAQDRRGTLKLAAADPVPPALPIGRNEFVEVRTKPEERVVEFLIGPLNLEAGLEHLRPPIQMAEVPVDGWFHGYEIEMLDAEGNAIPHELLHHVNFIDPHTRELFSAIARRVMAAGRETDAERLPRPIGYPVAQGDRLLIASMFANPLGEDYPDAFLHVRFFYSTEADGFLQPRNIFPFYLDVVGPLGDKGFDLPPGKTTKYWEGRPAVGGRMLAIGGHVHDYATRLALVDMTAARTVWEAELEVDRNGHVSGVPSKKFLWSLGKKIYADHVYRVVVEYDNPLDVPARDGGMGAVGGVVWVGKSVAWPTFDRTNEMYVEDLTNTLTAPDRMHGHGHGGMNVTGDMQGMPGMGAAAPGEGAPEAESPEAAAGHSH